MKPVGYTLTAPEIPAFEDDYGDHPGGLLFIRYGDEDRKWILGSPEGESPVEIRWDEVSRALHRGLRDFSIPEGNGGLLATGAWREDAFYLTLFPGHTHWNGVSGGGRDTALTLFASCVHDMLYLANRRGYLFAVAPAGIQDALRSAADLQMRRHLIADARRAKPERGGFYARSRAEVTYRLLKAFGGPAWRGDEARALHPGERMIAGRWGVL